MRWRCLNANCWETQFPGYDFEAASDGTCPKCGASHTDPVTARYVIRLAIIHYDPPHPKIAGLGKGYVLCDGSRHVSVLHKGQLQRGGTLEQATASPEAVNCPACMAHPDFPGDGIDERRAVPGWRLGQELQDKKDGCGGCK